MLDDAGASSKNEQIIAEKDVSNEIDLMDLYSHQIQIEYSGEELRVFVIDANFQQQNKQPILKTPLKLTDYIKLDNGSAFLGFTHETINVVNQLSLENWTFVSEARSNQ